MPVPKVRGNETQNAYMERCMGWATDEFDDQEQAVAVCLTNWRDAKGLPQPKAAQVRMVYKAYLFKQLAFWKAKLQKFMAKQTEEEKIEGAPEDIDEPDKSKTGENITETD